MAQPNPIQVPPRVRQRRSAGIFWVLLLLVAAIILAAATGAYELGSRFSPAGLSDPLWLRAYLRDPLDTAGPGDGFWIAGYYVDYDRSSLETIKLSAGHMDQVVLFGYGFDSKGNLQGKDQEIIRGITGTQKRVLLFSNLTNGSFDKDTAHALLTDPAVRDRAINAILEKALALPASGVQIDFENVPPGDRDAYTAFLRQLKQELSAQKRTLSVAAAAKTRDTRTGWGGATDYVAIGQIVDQIYIMAYDEHYTGGPPGPVASLGWTERVVRYATGVMPAQKIILGVPFYGYEWSAEPNAKVQNNKAYGGAAMARRTEQFGAKVAWDDVVGENVATFRTEEGERIAWYPDARSLEAKLKLAYQYNLKGIAPWRFGFEPNEWWQQMGAFRLQPTK